MLPGKSWFSKFMVSFGYLMALIYIGLGVVLLTSNIFPVRPPALKFSFALFFIAYGFFRLVKLLTRKPKPDDITEPND
jgi:prolipoprotein diacylglyceryltransferase